MKYIVVFFFTIYQLFSTIVVKHLFGITASCRYSPTCSLYVKEQVLAYGVLKGGLSGLKRLLSCHPFASYGTV